MLIAHRSLLALVCLTAFSLASAVAGTTKVYYPNKENMEFVVEIPSDWKLIPQGEEGAEDYMEVEGPNGLELSFRTVPGSDIEKAINDHFAYLKENFGDVKVDDAKSTKINGMDALLGPGTGTDEDGNKREFGAGWFQISDDKIGELWYNVAIDDKEGAEAAVKVLNSLKNKE